MNRSGRKRPVCRCLAVFTIVLLMSAAISGPMLQASMVIFQVSITVDDIEAYSFTVSGSTKVSPFLGRGLRYRSKGAPSWFEFGIPSGDPFTKTFAGTMGTTYEVQAYVVENKASTLYSKIIEVVPHEDVEFIVTSTPDHDLIDDDLLIGFTLDIEPNGNTITDVSISINGPGLSSSSSGLSVPVTQKYTTIQGNAVYTVDFDCVTNLGTYSHQVVYNTTLTATPTPTPGPTATPTPTPTEAPVETTMIPETTPEVTETSLSETKSQVEETTVTLVESDGDGDDTSKRSGFFSSENLTMLIVLGVIILLLIAAAIILIILRTRPRPPTEP